jgi:hypothetical protein
VAVPLPVGSPELLCELLGDGVTGLLGVTEGLMPRESAAEGVPLGDALGEEVLLLLPVLLLLGLGLLLRVRLALLEPVLGPEHVPELVTEAVPLPVPLLLLLLLLLLLALLLAAAAWVAEVVADGEAEGDALLLLLLMLLLLLRGTQATPGATTLTLPHRLSRMKSLPDPSTARPLGL